MPQAIIAKQHGGPEVLQHADLPVRLPGPREVVVGIRECGVSLLDCHVRAGRLSESTTFPYVAGVEVCGTVLRVGRDVTDLTPGAPVFAMANGLGGLGLSSTGGYQAQAIVNADALVHIPEEVTPELFGQLGMPAITAWLALVSLKATAGMRVLICGDGNATSLAAIQLLKVQGCYVIEASTSELGSMRARAAGADECLVRPDMSWTKAEGTIERVLDVTGNPNLGNMVGALTDGGRVLIVDCGFGGDITVASQQLLRRLTITGFSALHVSRVELQAAANIVAGYAHKKRLAPLGVEAFGIAEANAAHQRLESGSAARPMLRTS